MIDNRRRLERCLKVNDPAFRFRLNYKEEVPQDFSVAISRKRWKVLVHQAFHDLHVKESSLGKVEGLGQNLFQGRFTSLGIKTSNSLGSPLKMREMKFVILH